MATLTEDHPTAETIRQSITNRILDIEEEERHLEQERKTLVKASAVLAPQNAPRRPGRPRKAS